MRINQLQTVTVVVLPQSSMMSLAAVIDPLRAANRLARRPMFEWRIKSFNGESIRLTSNIDIAVEGELSKYDSGDALIVVAGFEHDQWAGKKHMMTLREAARRHNLNMGVEAGTWLLAKSGTISDHRVTTHWEDLELLASSYPGLSVRHDRYTIDRNIWTCGGASPALDMMLQYIRTSQHRSLALEVANVFVYDDSHPASDTQVMSATSRLKHLESRVAQAVNLMEENLDDPISIRAINATVGVSSKTLEQLFKLHLDSTPKAFYLRLRLQAARRLVLDSQLKLTEIAVRSGFNSQTHFTRSFKRHFGVAPRILRSNARAWR